MLFSNPAVQDLVRTRFSAAWQSVRPVPRVTIDFGEGHRLERTVNGNVATYVCDPEGRVIDVIPGVCDPEAYVRALQQALDLYEKSRADFAGTVLAYHRERSLSLLAPVPIADFSKIAVERPLKTAVGVASLLPPAAALDPRIDRAKGRVEVPMKRSLSDDEQLLVQDAELNRTWREPLVHALLARAVVHPADITKELYREVLHVDLDDPYLGLAGGPFAGGAYAGVDVVGMSAGANR